MSSGNTSTTKLICYLPRKNLNHITANMWRRLNHARSARVEEVIQSAILPRKQLVICVKVQARHDFTYSQNVIWKFPAGGRMTDRLTCGSCKHRLFDKYILVQAGGFAPHHYRQLFKCFYTGAVVGYSHRACINHSDIQEPETSDNNGYTET